MLASAFLLLLNGAFLSLRLGAGSGSFPRPLPAKEERRCVERWMQGDLEARNTLIEHNLRLVAHIIKKYYTSESEQDDLISIGTVGLIKGVSTYRPDKGVRLATYASRCIENEVLMHFRGSRKSAGDLSLSDSIDTDSDGNSLSLIDVLADEEDMSERVVQTDLCQHLSQLIDNVLDEREAEILHRVMIIDFEVARRFDLKVEEAVFGEECEHMIHKGNAGVDGGGTGAVQRELDRNIGFAGSSADFREAFRTHKKTPGLWLCILYTVVPPERFCNQRPGFFPDSSASLPGSSSAGR